MNLDFSEFSADSEKSWKQRIEKELKGKPFENLVWNHSDGFNVNPNQSFITDNSGVPGKFPYLRGVKTESNNWEINQLIDSDSESKMNQRALAALEGGAEGLVISLEAQIDLTQVLKGVYLNYVGLHFVGEFTTANIQQLEQLVAETELSSKDIYGSAECCLCHKSQESRARNLSTALALSEKFPRIKAVKVRGDELHNKGALASTELALALSIGHESLVKLVKAGMSIDKASAAINFSLGIGSSYFTELTKFRTLRQLWALVINKYNPEHSCSRATYVQAFSGNWNKTTLDQENNLLRTTTEAMSAVLGGVDAVCVIPFNHLTKNSSNSGMRYARNIQHLLKSESFLNQTIDPAGGSYYIEKLTKELREKTWEKFCLIESMGGILALQSSGKINQMLEKDAAAQKSLIRTESRVVVGVNKFKPVKALSALDNDDRLAKEFEV